MPQEPQIKALSMRRRNWFFRLLVFVFLLALPAVIFYTTGYRLSFENDATSIVTTGGMYIDTANTDVQVYLNEEEYDRPRLFQSAYYLQNIAAGQHRIVVQAQGLHTWVKELPVDSHIVIEASAFNLPTIPQLRPITEFQSDEGRAVYFGTSTASIFGTATATQPFVLATSSATTSYQINPEYEFVQALFASSTVSTTSVFEADSATSTFRILTAQEIAEASSTVASTSPSARIIQNDIELLDRDEQLFAIWQGRPDNIPYYFCVSSTTKASTTYRYGQHVADAIFYEMASSSATTTVFDLDGRTCRTEIQLNRLQQDVYAYSFFPGASNLALLHLTDGLYVTEIDDRAWQNTQPLLLGEDFLMLVENDVIYISRNGNLFELITEIDSN